MSDTDEFSGTNEESRTSASPDDLEEEEEEEAFREAEDHELDLLTPEETLADGISDVSTELDANVSKADTPLPLKQLFVLFLMTVCDGLGMYQLIPYVGFMILDFHLVDDLSETGFYAGFMASSFAMAQFTSSVLWGKLSDRYGRRPILLIGMAGTIMATLGFAFSTTFAWAIAFRMLAGLLNGNIGVVKTYLAEITDDSNKSRAFSVIGIAGGGGRVLGSLIGGFTARPAMLHPDLVSKDSFLGVYAYFLPSIITAVFTTIGWVCGYFFLPETLNRHYTAVTEEAADQHTQNGTELSVFEDQDEQDASSKSAPLSIEMQEFRSATLAELEAEETDALVLSGDLSGDQVELSRPLTWKEKILSSLPTILLVRNVWVVCSHYGLVALIVIVFDDVFPLYAMNTRANHGLDFDTDQIGIFIAFGGAVLITYQLFGYTPMAKFFGPLKLFRVAMIAYVPMLLLFPHVSLITSTVPMWIGLLLLMASRYVISISAFTSVFILISNSTEPARLGMVNGLGQTLAALARAIGPMLADPLFAWSVSSGNPFPLDYRLIFLIMVVLALMNFALSFLLSRNIEKSKTSHEEFVRMQAEDELPTPEGEESQGYFSAKLDAAFDAVFEYDLEQITDE